MKPIENNILEAWKEFRSKIVITIKDVDKLEKVFGNALDKIKRQRERLESSRDYWKNKCKELVIRV